MLEPNQEDYLDKVWIKVINLDPNASWIQECRQQLEEPVFSRVVASLNGILERKPQLENLGRFYRFVRYQTSLATFRALEDPGLKEGKVRGLHRQLAASKDPKTRKRLAERAFFTALWKIIDADDRGKSLENLQESIASDAPFGDVPPAIKSLLKKKISVADLNELGRWHRYDAIFELLRLMDEEGFRHASEIPGLHEILLGLEPSGKEARAGSWPFLRSIG